MTERVLELPSQDRTLARQWQGKLLTSSNIELEMLHIANTLAIESALRYGIDVPVGAVIASSQTRTIVGAAFASDKRLNRRDAHAEVMAGIMSDLYFAENDIGRSAMVPDLLVVNLEPCDNCQDKLARRPGLRQVGYGLPRRVLEDRQLLKFHAETIDERADRVGLPYDVFHIDDEEATRTSEAIYDHTYRDPVTEQLLIDSDRLREQLREDSAAFIATLNVSSILE